ncbi:MAG: hypothetical protein OEW11_08090 [Nitrospirota bacterium]|nr:hypothetical protein [Nitrospirota bacterium]
MFTLIYACIVTTAIGSGLFLALGVRMTRQKPTSTTTCAPVAGLKRAA